MTRAVVARRTFQKSRVDVDHTPRAGGAVLWRGVAAVVVPAEVGVGVGRDRVVVRVRPLAVPVLAPLPSDRLAHIAAVVGTRWLFEAAVVAVEAVAVVVVAGRCVAQPVALAVIAPLDRALALT